MKSIEQDISAFTESLFPAFYHEEGEMFVDFVKAYYEWFSESGSENRKILEYSDVDYTVDAFINNFRSQYLNSLPIDTIANIPFLVKHIQDLYKSKGSSQSYKLLFRLLFNEDIEVYDPGTDILRASDGIWIIPRYLECSRTDRSFDFIGKQITGSETGATAFVDSVIRKRINGRMIDVFFISKLKGTFSTGELITDDGVFEQAPEITGSLNDITISNGGSGNRIGDLFDISGDSGKGGLAVVREITNGTGKVEFTLRDGGFGYRTTSNVIISNTIIATSNTQGVLIPFDAVEQPLQLFTYSNLVGNIALMSALTGYNVSNVAVANGYLVSVSASNTSTGNVIVSDTGGVWPSVRTIRLTSNTSVLANVSAITNATASATVVDSNTNFTGIYNISNTFYSNAYMNVLDYMPIGLSTANLTSNTITGSNTEFSRVVSVGDTIYVRANNAVIGKVTAINSNTSISIASNSSLVVANSTLWTKHTRATVNTGRVYDTGSGAKFNVGFVDDTETITVNTTLINSLNANGVNLLDVLISGVNSNVSSNGYGFTKSPSIGYNGIIFSALDTANVTVGHIVTLTGKNLGNNYNADPMLQVLEPTVAAYYKQDVTLETSGLLNIFAGDSITQTVSLPRYTLNMSSNTLPFTIGEGVVQTTSNASGTVVSTTSGAIIVNVIEGTFVASNNVTGQTSGSVAAISAATIGPAAFGTAKGFVKSIENNLVSVRRMSFETGFVANNTIQTDIGSATVTAVIPVNPYKPIGLNANVSAKVVTANGIATTVEVLASGYGYRNGDDVSLAGSSNTEAPTITGTAIAITNGKAEGFWKNNQGKLNSDKYIHDNKYYQEFSYEIRSSLSLATYADILKKTLHVAGTELFGKTVIQKERSVELSTTGVEASEI